MSPFYIVLIDARITPIDVILALHLLVVKLARQFINYMQRFGEKLRILRKQHNKTMKELADELGFASHGYVGDLESGRKKPSLDVALKISRIFDVSVDRLIKDELDID